ncbi:alpha/beta fold hydrolase [Staphylococcus simulans]
METINLPGATLQYHKVGKGPVLILIPGANGTGDIFLPLAQHLANDFTVIAVDRRGYGNSSLTEPLPAEASNPDSEYRVKRDAQDIAEIAKYESEDEPVYVLGSSSGSIVAMHVLKDHPEVVKHIAFHEPPINSFLPDAQYWQAKNEDIVEVEENEGMVKAMELFFEALDVAPIDREMMSKPEADSGEASEQRIKEMQNWFLYEIRQYTSSNITLDDFKPYLDRITLLNGTDSHGSFPQKVNEYIASELGLNIVEIPGGHLGYVQKPEGFAKVLLNNWA